MGETENSAIGIVVLAAGASSRMRQPKQLLQFQKKTLVRRAAETAVETGCRPVVVVLGANFDLTQAEIADLPIEICFNENYSDGLSSSIKSGLSLILKIAPKISAVMMTLADQPLISSAHLQLLTAKFGDSGKKIIAARYGSKAGVPALFDKSFFDELMQLKGDIGAGKLISEHLEFVKIIDLPAAFCDVDTPEDFENLL